MTTLISSLVIISDKFIHEDKSIWVFIPREAIRRTGQTTRSNTAVSVSAGISKEGQDEEVMATCKFCQAEIQWNVIYSTGKYVPVNLSGTAHDCRNRRTN